MKRLTIILTTALLACNFSCSSGTEPEEKKSVRDYTWTADTLAYPGSSQTLMRSIWGSSASDIYVCGHNSNNEGSLWHYGGNFWRDIKLFDFIPRSPYDLTSVHGTSKEDIWVVGYRQTGDNPNPPPQTFYQSLILHYNGTKWVEQNVNTKSEVYSVYATSENDVWACGADGIVYHFDGSIWVTDTIKVAVLENGFFQLLSIIDYKNQQYVTASKIEENGAKRTDYFFARENNNWALKDSFITPGATKFGWGGKMYKTSYNKLYSYGFGGLFEFNGIGWENVYTEEIVTGIFENGADNITLTNFNKGYHFNGSNWQELQGTEGENLLYTGVYMGEAKAFLIGITLGGFPQKTIVLQGN